MVAFFRPSFHPPSTPAVPPPHSGIKQSGEKLDDVVLPPWAKGDAHEFIRINREVRDKFKLIMFTRLIES